MDRFAEPAKQLEKFYVQNEITTYGGAPHAFTVFGTDRYREYGERKSWKRFVYFLD